MVKGVKLRVLLKVWLSILREKLWGFQLLSTILMYFLCCWKEKFFINWKSLQIAFFKTSERTKVQITSNFDTIYGIRRIAASDSISENEFEIKEATNSCETTRNTKDYSDHKIFVFQKETSDNVNLIADISEGNIQILANQSEISTTSKTSKEDLIKAIDISISKILLKYADYVLELCQLCMEFIISLESIIKIWKSVMFFGMILIQEMQHQFTANYIHYHTNTKNLLKMNYSTHHVNLATPPILQLKSQFLRPCNLLNILSICIIRTSPES